MPGPNPYAAPRNPEPEVIVAAQLPDGKPTYQVPDGSVRELMAWVADDKTRAQAALDAENAKSNPRKSAVQDLHEVLSS